jgi:glycosyltransferase involved in cell wall biosynthesis
MRVCLHIFLTAAKQESRFLREAGAQIASGLFDEVVLAAKWEPGLAEEEVLAPGIRVWRVRLSTAGLPKTLPMQLLKMVEWRARIVRFAKGIRPKLIVAHSLAALPVGVAAKRATGAPLLYDAHELETERNGLHGWRQRLERRTERRLVRHCDAMVVVSDSIADWYAREYGIPRPFVVRNVPELTGAPPPADRRLWRDRFGIPDDHLIFIYQGGLFRGRRIEQFLRVFAAVGPERHVIFMGYGELEPLVREAAARHPNIHFAPAVPPRDVLRHTAAADVGLVGVENICLSYYFSLPNKLFEFLAAGLPVLMPAYPEMVRVAKRCDGCRVVGESDRDWLMAMQEPTPARGAMPTSSGRATMNPESWEGERDTFVKACRGVLASG